MAQHLHHLLQADVVGVPVERLCDTKAFLGPLSILGLPLVGHGGRGSQMEQRGRGEFWEEEYAKTKT